MANDFKLQEEIRSLLKNRMNLSAYDINIEIEDGRVSLSGVVDVLAEKNQAGEMVSRLPWVKKVDNNLTIAMEKGIEDKQIAQEVLAKFEELGIDPRHIGVEASHGMVKLVGNVAAAAESLAALRAAEKVRGVKEVLSALKLAEESTRDDATITNAVETALSRSDEVDVRDVMTETKNGTVYLSGWVDSQQQIDAAVALANSVTGVKKVHNHLRASGEVTEGDVALTNEARRVLSKAGLGVVKVFVVNGTAFLGGIVQSIDQKHKAGETVHKVDGLTGVHNAITVALH
ncbi:MAG: BON domain-containing protein [Clostridia bacterium]|nr:BON domain-containing protein [Clostridia bacterium]